MIWRTPSGCCRIQVFLFQPLPPSFKRRLMENKMSGGLPREVHEVTLPTRRVLHQQSRNMLQVPFLAPEPSSGPEGNEGFTIPPTDMSVMNRGRPLSYWDALLPVQGCVSHPAPIPGPASPSQGPGPAAPSAPGIFLQESSWRGTSLRRREERASGVQSLEMD